MMNRRVTEGSMWFCRLLAVLLLAQSFLVVHSTSGKVLTPAFTDRAEAAASVETCDPNSDAEILKISEDGIEKSYEVWVSWTPQIVLTPDCGAWAFFSAQSEDAQGSLGTKKLFAARFDPSAQKWSAATAMSGGEIQFGANAVVDDQGTVHLVYTDRVNDDVFSYGQLIYVQSTGDGGWTDPLAVASDQAAGHQLSPELFLDKNGALHLVWQDQRNVSRTLREAAASNADVFSSDLGTDGDWSAAVQINSRPDFTTNASRPQLGSDGDRLIVIWSVYDAESGLDTAARLEWSTRPIEGSSDWSSPQTLLERSVTQFGGRLLDVAADPNGGVFVVFGRRTGVINTLYAKRLEPGSDKWSVPYELLRGDEGSFPSADVAPDGTLWVVYNVGSEEDVNVGIVSLSPGAEGHVSDRSLTGSGNFSEGRANLAIDRDGQIWVIYMQEPIGGLANAIWCLKNVIKSTRDT